MKIGNVKINCDHNGSRGLNIVCASCALDAMKAIHEAGRAEAFNEAWKLCSGSDPRIAHSAWCAAIKDELSPKGRIDCAAKCAHVVLGELALKESSSA